MLDYLNINGEIVPHTIFPIERDGACLFRSLAFLMYGSQMQHRKVRQNIITYVISNWEKYSIMSYNKFGDNHCTQKDYQDEMSRQDTFGTTCELVAAGDMYNYFFEVYRDGNLLISCGDHNHPVKRLRFTGCLQGGHFDAYIIKNNIPNYVTNIDAEMAEQDNETGYVVNVETPIFSKNAYIYEIFGDPIPFNTEKLPTRKDIFRRLFMLYNKKTVGEGKKLHMFCETVASEIDFIWKKTKTPTISQSSIRIKVILMIS